MPQAVGKVIAHIVHFPGFVFYQRFGLLADTGVVVQRFGHGGEGDTQFLRDGLDGYFFILLGHAVTCLFDAIISYNSLYSFLCEKSNYL